MTLKAPFPWFGGKSRVADVVWERFGDVPNYVEPFAGSLAVLLGRPTAPRIETVNDKDAYLANFWRAVAADPEAVAHFADWPVNEADLRSRHLWLVREGRPIVQQLMEDPDFYDPKVAGWWVWGLSQWIGGEWCTDQRAKQRKLPDMAPGKGVHRQSLHNKRPHLMTGGKGVHRLELAGYDPNLKESKPHLKGSKGVHGRTVWHTKPHLSGMGSGVHRGEMSDLTSYMLELADRLRRVRVCCGDWKRVVTPSVTIHNGMTGVVLDPPYSTEAGRRMDTYHIEDGEVAHAVREWAIANGDNPKLRIALCGYEGEHDVLEQMGWEVYAWESHGGYASLGNGRGQANRKRERIWFSPHCLRQQLTIFDMLQTGGPAS